MPNSSHSQFPPRPRVEEQTLGEEHVSVERKTFVLLLKENPRGRFIRIIEEAGSKSNSIIVPSTGLEAFHEALGKLIAASKQAPPNQTQA